MAHPLVEVVDVAHLQRLLEGTAGIDLSLWGKNGASTVQDLFNETTVFDLTLSEQSLQRVAPEGHACLDPETGTIIQCAWVKD